MRMARPDPLRFTVMRDNEEAALRHLEARGFAPAAIERDERGASVLIFRPPSDTQLHVLVQALPVQLSAKIGFVVGDGSPFPQDQPGTS